MTRDRVIELYEQWEEAVNYPEPNLKIVASLESQALAEGIDLREVNYVLVHGLTAAVWNPDLHPRGRDGRFIEVFGLIQLFDFDGGRDGTRGKVKSIRPGTVKGNPDIDVELPDGSTVTVKPNQVASAPEAKANLPLGRDAGDFVRSVPRVPSAREVQEFEGRTDIDAERARAMFDTQQRLEQEEAGANLDRFLYEEILPNRPLSKFVVDNMSNEQIDTAIGVLEEQGVTQGEPTDVLISNYRILQAVRRQRNPQQQPQPSQLIETEGLEEAFSTGVPRSVAEGFERYRLDAESRGEEILDLDDWVRAGQPGPEPEEESEGFLPGGMLTEEQARTTPLWMAEDALADEDADGEEGERARDRIRIDIENIKRLQGEGPEAEVRRGVQSHLDGVEPINEDTILREIDSLDQADARELLQEMIDANEGHDRLDVLKEALYSIEPEEGPTEVPEGRPFENLDDADLQARYAESVDRLIGDVPENEMADLELENTLLREELDRRGISRTQPAPPAEPRTYNQVRDVGKLMVGDEVILPGDIPGVVEDFEFSPNDQPGMVTLHTDNGSYRGKMIDILPSFREGEDEQLTPAMAGANVNQIGEEISVEAGEVGSKENPLHTSDVMEAVTALHEGKYVELESIDQVSTLLDELARIANEAKEAGEKAPNYDLCLVSVPGTNLFCAESKGIPRIEMPQLSGIPVPGSQADELPKNSDGEVNIGPAFAEYLRNKGISVTEKRRPASHLKASQNELVGAKVAGMMKWLEGNSETARNVIRESSIFTTSDDYVVDGHHRWAAVVGLDAAEGGIEDLDMPVQEIDLPILDVLAEANNFATSFGVPPKGAGAGADVGGAPGGAGTV